MRTLIVLGSGLVVGVLTAQGCAITRPDPLHCGNNDGDAYCAAQFPDGSRPFCEVGEGTCASSGSELGCTAERPADECYSPCGGRSRLAENAECLMVEDSSSGSSSGGTETEASNGSESSTTGPVPCVGDEDCPDAAAPFCEVASGECVGCDGTEDPDGACAGADPGLPVCAGGACVQCTGEKPAACMGMTPVCDEGTSTCGACTAHDQCGEAACNLFIGACLPADAVVHVGPGQEYATLEDAVTSFPVETEGTIVVHQDDYDETVLVGGGRVVAFLAAEGDLPVWRTPSMAMAPQLTVSASTVLLDGLQLSGNDSSDDPAILMNGGRLWVDRSRVVQNSGGGIVAQSNAELVLRNCFVGGAAADVDAVTIDGSTLDMLYTTIGGGTVLGGRARALHCSGAAIADVRNSILVSADPMPEVECAGATRANSATEAEVGSLDITWFMGYATGNFSLSPSGAATFADIAQWQSGDPPIDIDGDPRPAVDGTPDYPGADLPLAAARPELDR